MAVQQFLDDNGFALATAGPGSLGNETDLFGPLTLRAVEKFQSAHDLPPTGYWGPMTRGVVSRLLAGSVPLNTAAGATATTGPAATTTEAASTTPPSYVPGVTVLPGYAPGQVIMIGGNSTTPPSVSLSAPSDDATVSGIVNLTASAAGAGNAGIANVQFYINGAPIGAAITTSPYATTWNSTGVSDGTYTLEAVAEDTFGNDATSSETVTVENTPDSISSIAAGTQTDSSAIFTWTTSEAANAEILYGTTDSYGSTTTLNSTLGTSHSAKMTGLSQGTTYHFEIVSTNAAGSTATSSDQTFSLSMPESGDDVLWGQRLGMDLDGPYENTTSNYRYAVYQILVGTPDWNVTDAQFDFPNFYYTAADPAEATTTAAVDILGAEVWSGEPDNGGTALAPLTFSGTSTIAIQPGTTTLSDPLSQTLTAGTPVYLRIVVDRGLNVGTIPQGYIRQTQNDERWQYSSSEATAVGLLATSTLTNDTHTTTSSLYKGYGPMFAVGKGWDGRKVVLLLGHSIVNGGSRSQTPDGAADSRGNKVYSAMALDSSSLTGGRISFGNISVPGITPSQQSMNPYSSDFYYRFTALQAVADRQGGRWPFTDIFLDIAVNGQSASASTWESSVDSNIAFTRGLFTGEPIVMPTMTPVTTNENSEYWTDLADQGFSSAANGPGPSAPQQQVDSYLLTDPNIDDPVDMMSALTAGNNDSWPVQSFSAILSTTTAAGASSVELSAAPAIGTALVFEPGTANAELVNAVASVTGSGPYTVTFTEGVTTANSHNAGVTVEAAATSDGIHPSVAFSEEAMSTMVAAINADPLP